MPNPFTPAIRLLNRLGYSKKFGVMGMLALIAIGLLLVNLYRGLHQVIEHSQRELAGLGLIKPITRVVWHAQIHRGLSSGVLNGETEMEPERAARQGEVERTLGEVATALKPELLTSDLWKGILDTWTSLRDEGLDLIPRENFLAHTRLIQDLLRLQGIVTDEYALRNDPDIASAYLIDMAIHESPRALEHMGQLRALGTGALTRGQPLVLSQQIEFTVLLTGLNSAVQGLRQKLDNMTRHAPELKGLLESPIQDMGAAAERITTLVNQDILSGVQATSPADYFKLTTESLERGYQELFGNMFPALERLLGARIERAQWDLATGIAIAALWILIYVYMSVGLYQATLGTIRRLAQHARRIATGDLGAHVELDTRDELKHLADSLNDMVTAFRALIQSVHLNAVQVLEAAQHLSASTGHIRDGSAQQSDAASSMAAAVEEMTTGIGHLAHNAQDAHRISGHAGDLSAEGGRVVSQVIQEIQRIAEVVNQSATIITELDGRSERISAIVNVIKGIADQTNLLALNAAIEAARAGESGRGFAVVAEEVRNLAERTGRSTQEISAMIDAIQQGTRHAAGSMRLGVNRVNEGVALATRAGQALDQIGGNVRQVVARVAEISHALGEQSGASHEIARNIEHIARMAEQNRGDVAESAVTATQLERLSTGLEAEVRRFRLA